MDAERKARLHGHLDGLMTAYATFLNGGKKQDALAIIDQQIKLLEQEMQKSIKK